MPLVSVWLPVLAVPPLGMARWPPWLSHDSPTLPQRRCAPPCHLKVTPCEHPSPVLHLRIAAPRKVITGAGGPACVVATFCRAPPGPGSWHLTQVPREAGRRAQPFPLFTRQFKARQPQQVTTEGGFFHGFLFPVSCADPC